MSRFRFISATGEEILLQGPAEVVGAVADGRLLAETLLYDESTARWRPAGEMEVFRLAADVTRASSAGGKASPAESAPAHVYRLTTSPPPPNESEPDDDNHGTWLRRAAIVMTGVWLALSAYGDFLRDGGPVANSVGYAFGGGAMGGLLIAGVRKFVRPEMKDYVWLTFALIFAGFAGEGVLEAIRTERDMVGALTAVSEQAKGAEPSVTADAGSLQEIFEQNGVGAAQAWDEYSGQIAATDQDWLAPATLATPAGRAAALKRAGEIAAAAPELQRDLVAVLDNTEGRLATSAYRSAVHEQALRGFRESRPTSEAGIRRYVAAEVAFAAAVRGLVEFLEATPVTLEAGSDRLLFRTDQQVARYNSFVAAIQQAAAEEEAALSESQSRMTTMSRVADSLLGAKGSPR